MATEDQSELELNFERKPLKLVIGVDDSKCSLHAFRFMDILAKKYDKIHIIHAPDKSVLECVNNRYKKYPEQDSKRFSFEILKNRTNQGEPFEKLSNQLKSYINSLPEKEAPDFFITGNHGATFEISSDKLSHSGHLNSAASSQSIGSFADTSLHRVRCTSIFVPRLQTLIPELDDDDNNIKPWIGVVGVDGSKNAECAFEVAAKLLQTEYKHERNMLYIVHVRHPSSNTQNMKEQFHPKTIEKRYTEYGQILTKKTGIKTKFEMIDGNIVSKPLCDYAESKKAHLIFVGEDGLAEKIANKGYLGSVSDKIVKIAPCAVVVSHLNELQRPSIAHMPSIQPK